MEAGRRRIQKLHFRQSESHGRTLASSPGEAEKGFAGSKPLSDTRFENLRQKHLSRRLFSTGFLQIVILTSANYLYSVSGKCGLCTTMESKETSAVQADGRWMEMDHVSESIHVLSEETLKQITKGSLVKFTLGCEDDQYG